MIFINLFTNLASNNPNRQPYLDAISKLITMEDAESESTNYYSGEFSARVAVAESSTTVDTINDATYSARKALNPTLFKDLDSTLPIINAFEMPSTNTADTFGFNFLRNTRPNATFINSCLKYNTGPEASRNNFTADGHGAPEDSYNLAQSLNLNQSSNSEYRFFRRAPNVKLAKIYKAFQKTITLNEKLNINNETHALLLNNQKNLCVVNEFKPNELLFKDTPIHDQHTTFRYLRDFLLITLALKANPEMTLLQLMENSLIEIPQKSYLIYKDTVSTDTNETFSHLNFDRLTDILLAQSSEDLNSQIEAIENITFNTYVKQNHLGCINDKKIFSFFSKTFFET